jgi:cell wall-associated NlpC family hydrolase
VRDITPITSQAFSKIIGIPYDVLDCWGVVKKFYGLHGIELPEHYTKRPSSLKLSEETIRESLDFYTKVNDMRYGDILVINLAGTNSHIGVFVGDGRFLHTTIKSNSCLDRIAAWKRRIIAIYRPKNEKDRITT